MSGDTAQHQIGHLERSKKRRFLMIGLTVAILFILGIGIGLVVMFTRPGQLTLTETDAGKTVQVQTGQQVAIQLDANATTGFSWAIDQTDPAILVLQRETYTPSGGGVGSGGTEVFMFRAQQAGTVHLQLKYWRSWLGDSSIIKRYNITIQVQG